MGRYVVKMATPPKGTCFNPSNGILSTADIEKLINEMSGQGYDFVSIYPTTKAAGPGCNNETSGAAIVVFEYKA